MNYKLVVVTFTHEQCNMDESARCPMEAYGPFDSNKKAHAFSETLADWQLPHTLFLKPVEDA